MSYHLSVDEFLDNIQNYRFVYDPEKDKKLRIDRGVGFKEVIALLTSRELVAVREHHNPIRYPMQLICEVGIRDYVYMVPMVVKDKEVFLKTIYPSRKATRKRGKNGKTHPH